MKRYIYPSIVSFVIFFTHQSVAIAKGTDCEPALTKVELEQQLTAGKIDDLKKHLLAKSNANATLLDSKSRTGELEKILARVAEEYLERKKKGEYEIPLTDAKFATINANFINTVNETCALEIPTSDELTGDTKSRYYFLLGNTNTLQGDGSFESGFTASLFSRTLFPVKDIPYLDKSSDRLIQGAVELTYTEIGALEESDDQTPFRSPFESDAGILRFNAYIDPVYSAANNTEGVGIRLGLGFGTEPGEEGSIVTTAERFFAGLVFKANYGTSDTGGDGVGEVFIGVAKDQFWRYEETIDEMAMTTREIDESERIVVDGRLDLPAFFKADAVRLHSRFFADLPTSGDGPSDIRISLAVTADLGTLFGAN